MWDPQLTDLQAQLSASLADRYLLERELGRGGMATVYLAYDLTAFEPVVDGPAPRAPTPAPRKAVAGVATLGV